MATDLERLTVLIEANTRSYERAMARIESRTDKAIRASSRSVKTLDSNLKGAIGTAKSFAAAFGAGAVVGGISQLPGLFRNVVAEAAGINDVAVKIGITTDALQALHYQATQNGSSAETMDAALAQFSRRLGEAATGTGDLHELLEANNIALRNADGSMRPMLEMLSELANLIAGAANESDRAVITMAAFGKAGQELGPVFSTGAAGIKATADEANRLNIIIDGELIQSAAEVDDKFDRWLTTLSSLGKTQVLVFMSELESFTNAAAVALANARGEAYAFGEALANLPSNFFGGINDTLSDFGQKAAGAVGLAKERARMRIRRGGEGGYENPSNWDFLRGRPPELDLIAKPQFTTHPGKDLDDIINQIRPTTVIPQAPVKGGKKGGGGSSKASEAERAAEAIKKERDAVDDLINSLAAEREMIGATETEQRLYNELKSAGSSATDAQIATIERLVPALVQEQEAYDKLVESMDFVRDTAKSAMSGFVSDMMAGTSAAEALSNVLNDIAGKLADRAITSFIDAAFGSSGTTGGGFFGSLFGGLFGGAKAAGGPVSAGRAYLVGEQGPELFAPKTAGRIIANDNVGGTSINYSPTIDARGSQMSEAQFKAILAQDKAEFADKIPGIVRKAQMQRRM